MTLETISIKTIFQGAIFDVRTDTIREGDVEYERDIVVHKGSAVIVPVFEDGTVALVRQYRHAAGEYLLEVPAGSLEDGEDPLEAAKRELEEEIGVVAEHIEKLCEFYVSPGFVTEKMHLYLATNLTKTKQNLDDNEIIEVLRFTFDELNEMIANGRIQDAKTMIGILDAEARTKSSE